MSVFLLLFSGSINSASAQDSSRLRISLLTCTPGDELYSIFGHSAIRIVDSNSVNDIVYNYGTFNFDDEGFYLKFVRGKLNYYLSLEQFEEFKFLYQVTNRGITEQVLNFSAEEKKNIQHALNENLREENKYYQYDFFFDNCTTRLRDIIVKAKSPTPVLPAVRPTHMRFRQAIHEYLDRGKQYWSQLGIDILLGAPTDRIMTASEQQFLPDNLMMALDRSKNVSVVKSSENLYQVNALVSQNDWFTPMVFFTALLLFYVLVHILCHNKRPVLVSGMDGLLFFLTGLLGVVLIFMWTATDHSMTKNNYNLFWAIPSHLVISFFINSKNSRVKKYFGLTALAGILLLICWFFLPQQMNNALIPIVLLLIYRSFKKSFATNYTN